MKQIGLGFHNEMSAKNAMRGPYAYDSTNTPNTGLSWRVELLPYVEQGGLYQTFNLKEPWDGPANKGVSSTPLKVYTSPYEGSKASANTPYRVFYGGGSFFNEDGKPVRVFDIQDGFSNTILAVHAWEQVPWAAPRDFKYDPKAPLPKLGHPQSRHGGQVLMGDGSVRTVSDKVSEHTMTMTAMMTITTGRAGAENTSTARAGTRVTGWRSPRSFSASFPSSQHA
jgi:hypothetical protein